MERPGPPQSSCLPGPLRHNETDEWTGWYAVHSLRALPAAAPREPQHAAFVGAEPSTMKPLIATLPRKYPNGSHVTAITEPAKWAGQLETAQRKVLTVSGCPDFGFCKTLQAKHLRKSSNRVPLSVVGGAVLGGWSPVSFDDISSRSLESMCLPS